MTEGTTREGQKERDRRQGLTEGTTREEWTETSACAYLLICVGVGSSASLVVRECSVFGKMMCYCMFTT